MISPKIEKNKIPEDIETIQKARDFDVTEIKIPIEINIVSANTV